LKFVVRSPLSREECAARLASAVEGPIPKLGTRLTGWHVFGQAKAAGFEATIVGVKVGPDGKKHPSLRPLVRAQLSPSKGGTVVSGGIASRGSDGQMLVARLGAIAMAGLIALWAVASLSTRWPILAFDAFALTSVLLAWFTRRRFTGLRAEGEAELLAWVEKTIQGQRDGSPLSGR
jgi:hypothetical protein